MKYVDNPVEPQKRVSEKKKRVSVSTETCFAFPSSDELTEARQESRVVLYQSAQIRYAKFSMAQIKSHAAMQSRAKNGDGSPEFVFWHRNFSRITLLRVLAYATMCRTSLTQAEMVRATGLTAPFIRSTVRFACELGYIAPCCGIDGLLSSECLNVYLEMTTHIMQLDETRDLGDTLAVLNLVLSKDVRIEE
tara:strand:- start:72 stop:647 length:576 start_codon:yes stop_codon:yes gene_type:complete